MGKAATSKLVSHLLVVTLLVLATCSAHKNGYNSQRGRTSSRRGVGGIDQCYRQGEYACRPLGVFVPCYTFHQRCDGIEHCPLGEDEMGCATRITVTRTSFSTTTSTTTTTYTTTSSTTVSATTTTTVSSSITTTSTSSRKLTAIVPWKLTSSSTTLIETTTISYTQLVQVTNPAIGAAFGAVAIVCSDLAAVPAAGAAVGGNNVYQVIVSTPTAVISATAHVMCMPSTTSFV
ncbi:uncharacterized protein LOC123557529 [Mercenaria mercenaria]|uniref:uncharacterized protein LOC123557529 n=1 Tax=Mercenaria mercenaria TaxID=6596 RepID=UPI001E1D5A24|nr:uncharacterized protein LOC123557529 [Mercenaria mercenaria]